MGKDNKQFVDNKNILALTFSNGLSLQAWVDTGLFDREKSIYEKHLEEGHFSKVLWITYGENDEALCKQLIQEGKMDARIEVRAFPGKAATPLNAKRRGMEIARALNDIAPLFAAVKTDQMDGAWVADALHKEYGTPFLLRTGFTASTFRIRELQAMPYSVKRLKKWVWYRLYCGLEKRLYHSCSHGVVSSKHDQVTLQKRYRLSDDKISVMTNYIDIGRFNGGDGDSQRKNRLLFVGRLNAQKNLENMLLALKDSAIGMDIYGRDELNGSLQSLAEKNGLDVIFHSPVANNELPDIYRAYRYFILPSYYEGMPKTLLEAMSCGCVCLGTAVEGIQDIICDGENGVLIPGTDARTIAHSLVNISSISSEVAAKGMVYIKEHHSLEGIVAQEWHIIQKIYESYEK